jgi:hypothetical protein
MVEMREGLLWYDDDPGRNLAEKVGRAVVRYKQKFGAAPNVCYVHPSSMSSDGGALKVDGVVVASLFSVLRHHFWVGREDKQPKQ